MKIKFTNPTGRNTKAHIVTVGDMEYFFSYETCIAIRGEQHGVFVKARLANHWGPTTGRHFNELGCKDFPVLPDDEFERLIK